MNYLAFCGPTDWRLYDEDAAIWWSRISPDSIPSGYDCPLHNDDGIRILLPSSCSSMYKSNKQNKTKLKKKSMYYSLKSQRCAHYNNYSMLHNQSEQCKQTNRKKTLKMLYHLLICNSLIIICTLGCNKRTFNAINSEWFRYWNIWIWHIPIWILFFSFTWMMNGTSVIIVE